MKTYSSEFKDSILTKLLPPNNVGVPQLAAQNGIPRDTLYGWRREAWARRAGRPASATPAGTLEQRGEVCRGDGDRHPQ